MGTKEQESEIRPTRVAVFVGLRGQNRVLIRCGSNVVHFIPSPPVAAGRHSSRQSSLLRTGSSRDSSRTRLHLDRSRYQPTMKAERNCSSASSPGGELAARSQTLPERRAGYERGGGKARRASMTTLRSAGANLVLFSEQKRWISKKKHGLAERLIIWFTVRETAPILSSWVLAPCETLVPFSEQTQVYS